MNEFLIIDKFLKPLSHKNEGSLKLKDDIFYNKKKGIVISVDTYVQGVHFLEQSNPYKFLTKIFRSSLSDLYCKGIKPNTYFLSLGLNSKIATNSWLKNLLKILKSEQKKFNISLGGGDTTYSSKTVITITVLGYSKIEPVLRSGSKPNDDIYVTGDIGDSYLGLGVLKKKFNFGKYNNFFKNCYYKPKLQYRLSPFLNKIAGSSIDISDGLPLDLSHICRNSNCGADINLNLLPFSKFSKKLFANNKISPIEIFSKGDDYQILFTSNPKNRTKIIKLSKKLNTKISRIGQIKAGRNIAFEHNKQKIKINSKNQGYIHSFK